MGIMVWDWAGNQSENPDVVLSGCGDYMTLEVMAAIQLLKNLAPQLKTRFVSISEISCLGVGDEHNPCSIGTSMFNEHFTDDKPIIVNFHGYPIAIEKLLIKHPAFPRLSVHGYIDEGSTTTPFDMQLVNKTSRYHIAMDAICEAKKYNPTLDINVDELVGYIKETIKLHRECILATGEDPEEIVNWKWEG